MHIQMLAAVESLHAAVLLRAKPRLVVAEVPPMTVAAGADSAPELSDDQLEHVVGGLTRAWLEAP